MKKIFLTLLILIFVCHTVAFANENTAKQLVEDNKVVVSLQKQPTNKLQKQKITRNIACIIIQINGKVKDEVVNR